MKRAGPAAVLLLGGLVALPPVLGIPESQAKTERTATPELERTVPMRAEVGMRITLHGSGFSPRRLRNTVIFRSAGGRYAFAKPSRASSRKLVLTVPESAEGLLPRVEGRNLPSRFKLRVIVHNRRSSLTPRRISPVLVSSLPAGR